MKSLLKNDQHLGFKYCYFFSYHDYPYNYHNHYDYHNKRLVFYMIQIWVDYLRFLSWITAAKSLTFLPWDFWLVKKSKLYIPSTLNSKHWPYTVAENVKSRFNSWVFPFNFQAYILPHTLNCMCVSP